VTASPILSTPTLTVEPGCDITGPFRAAYENRYTWAPGFPGYRGRCLRLAPDGTSTVAAFRVGSDSRAEVEEIADDTARKAMAGQLWEVAIHRVRRAFEQTHGENTFVAGDTNEVGIEVIVGGKNAGDRYRINNDIVTMVVRRIHGTVVTIFTESTIDTGAGYLSRTYTSRYADPETGEARGGTNRFTDTFVPLRENLAAGDVSDPVWVLSERLIESQDPCDPSRTQLERYRFEELSLLD
jgi:hypothetical protein